MPKELAPAVQQDARGRWVSIDALTEGVVVLDGDGSPLWSNLAADRILGRPTAEFLVKAADLGLVAEDGTPFPISDFPAKAALCHGRIVTDIVMGFITLDGSRRWITVSARPLARPARRHDPAALVTFVDVTRLQAAQQSADEALALLQRVFETSVVAVAVTRLGPPDDGRFVLVNHAFTQIVGWSQAQLLAMTSTDLIHSEDRTRSRQAREDLIAGRLPDDRLEIRLVRPDGSAVWCLLQRTLVRDAHGVARFAFGQIDDLTERRAAEASMAEQALTDWLTGLPNRRRLHERLHEALNRHRGRVGVLFVDLDGFKQVNDRYGHEVGDRSLVLAAQHLTAAVDRGALLARLGGDEFVVLVEPADDIEALAALADRLRLLEIPSGAPDGRALRVSVGAVVAEPDETAEHVLRRADAAMYQSKALAATRTEAPAASPRWV